MTVDNRIRTEAFELDILSTVKDIMSERGLTVKALATDMGVHHNTLYSWFRGERRLPLGALPNFAYGLNITKEELINGG